MGLHAAVFKGETPQTRSMKLSYYDIMHLYKHVYIARKMCVSVSSVMSVWFGMMAPSLALRQARTEQISSAAHLINISARPYISFK